MSSLINKWRHIGTGVCMKSTMQAAIDLIKKKGIVRSSELTERGIPRVYITRLVNRGYARRVSRGLYEYIDREITEKTTIALVCKKIPNGVICLLSALEFHDMTTQMPRRIWIATDRETRIPRVKDLPVRVMRFSGAAMKEGIEEHKIEGVTVKVFNIAKTVADCFKFRNKVGLDVALEALREVRRKRLATSDDLWRYARICRVSKVMRPYMEAI
jgi:predicted transcriptional regulator of viral defense system